MSSFPGDVCQSHCDSDYSNFTTLKQLKFLSYNPYVQSEVFVRLVKNVSTKLSLYSVLQEFNIK